MVSRTSVLFKALAGALLAATALATSVAAIRARDVVSLHGTPTYRRFLSRRST